MMFQLRLHYLNQLLLHNQINQIIEIITTIEKPLRLLIACPWHCIFNFFIYKHFFRPIWSVTFGKNVLVFIYLYPCMITNFKFRIFIIVFIPRVDICTIFNMNMFHFNCSLICVIVFIYYII